MTSWPSSNDWSSRLPSREAIQRELARRKLLAFTTWTFPRYRPASHHQHIAAALEAVERGEIDRLMIVMPPRHGKSELVSVRFPAWYLGRNPDRRVIGASYAAALAERFSRQARNVVASPRWPFDVALAADSANVRSWDIGGQRGGYIAAGVGGPITGAGAHLLLIDDPIKNQEEADSPVYRENIWEWYTSTAYTRLEEGGAIVLVQCMTGDTPVRMADGTERPLRDIRPSDRVATYDRGKLAGATVLNHASQGYDNIYRIITNSGVIVHANERHPFLVEEHGQCRWVRLRDLTTAHRIVTVRGSGASGGAAPAPLRAAISLSPVGDSARRTTRSRSGQTGIVPHPSTRRPTASATSSIGTASPPPSMTRCWPHSAVSALSASGRGRRAPRPTGTGNSASITITIPGPCAASSATTVTSPQVASVRRESLTHWRPTSDFTTDGIASIEPAGVAEVFDLQIAHTENFIANGLVSHNTRWHDDDLAGRLLRAQAAGGDRWTVLHLPALSEDGAALWPEKYDPDALLRIKAAVGSRVFEALYQGRPSSDETSIFKRTWWRSYVTLPADVTRLVQSWDMTFKDTRSSDYVVGQVWAQRGADYYLLDQVRGRLSFTATLAAVRALTQKWPDATTKLVEDKANGTAVIDTLRHELPGLIPVNPEGGKVARAQAVSPLVEAGNVYLPDPRLAPWIGDFIQECSDFPTGAHDDQVDTMTQALHRLRNFGLPYSGYGDDDEE